MTYTGFSFNGKHSYKDLGLTIQHRKIGNPSKIKNTARVPYSNQIYDFSNIYSGQEYDEREIEYTLNLISHDKSTLDNSFYMQETVILNWLMQSNKKEVLRDDLVPGYYFLAEVVGDIDTDFLWEYGELNVKFKAAPFKYSDLLEGNDLWDPFNFELDVFQDTEFKVSGSRKITLYNVGSNTVIPQIVVDSRMTIKTHYADITLNPGTHEVADISLIPGENNFTVTGNGHITFNFRKELI